MLSGALKRLIALSCALAAFAAGAQTAWAYESPFAGTGAYIGRTDMGVDACLTPGDPVRAVGAGVVIGVIKDWYAGQPLVYFELLDGRDAGRVQYVAEQITDIAPPGTILQRGQPIARYASKGTAIEYGWSTINGITLAKATTGYEEGQVTPAGRSIRRWLNALGANAGPS